MSRTDVSRHRFRQERQFGQLVGGIFVAIATWIFWRRGLTITSGALGLVGGTLVILGSTVPSALVHPLRWWMTLAEGLSWVSTRIILALVFFGAVLPIGWTMRRFGWDPMQSQRGSGSRWTGYSARQRNEKHFDQMY